MHLLLRALFSRFIRDVDKRDNQDILRTQKDHSEGEEFELRLRQDYKIVIVVGRQRDSVAAQLPASCCPAPSVRCFIWLSGWLVSDAPAICISMPCSCGLHQYGFPHGSCAHLSRLFAIVSQAGGLRFVLDICPTRRTVGSVLGMTVANRESVHSICSRVRSCAQVPADHTPSTGSAQTRVP